MTGELGRLADTNVYKRQYFNGASQRPAGPSQRCRDCKPDTAVTAEPAELTLQRLSQEIVPTNPTEFLSHVDDKILCNGSGEQCSSGE